MHIISGKYKGQIIKYPEHIRPSTAKHKKMVFDTIRHDLPGGTFLDLFSGSGQMGLEAISLGAKSVDFIDAHPRCVKIIKENISLLNLDRAMARVHQADIVRFINTHTEQYDIIMADPPYLEIDWSKFSQIDRLAHRHTILILKYSPHNPPPSWSKWPLVKQKNAKDTIINFYLRS
ncbi:MAG: RsmD family RNA methyltransferase [Patescibacteria group bacterium]